MLFSCRTMELGFLSITTECSAMCHAGIYTCLCESTTVEPVYNVTFGTSYSVHYIEVPFFGGYI